ncbi:hypothetical protein TNCV_3374621 [Trichonephila clavipes]|nr:hypothetical protein TNCV_3374621 [Trichonephila clavipes]
MPEGTIADAISCWSHFRKATPESLLAIWNKKTDVGLKHKEIWHHWDNIQKKNKRVSEIRMKTLVSVPYMHLVPTFGASTPASSIAEGKGSTIVRHYPVNFCSLISDSCSPPRKAPGAHFSHTCSKNFKVNL